MKLDIIVGPPGSGKSTYAKNLSNIVYVNQDSQGREGHQKVFQEALNKKLNIIVDRMNFDKAQRAKYIVPARKAGYAVNITTFAVPRKICFDRMMERKNHETINNSVAANSALNLFFGKYERPTPDEGTLNFSTYITEKKPAVICDLDGTLCNIDHRLHYVKSVDGQKKNWPAFFRAIPRDSVNQWCAEILRRFSLDHEIVYCSGRDETCREMTETWLKKHNLWFGNLFMRAAGDYRPDSIAKEILLDFDILPQFEPLMVIDDRKSVTQMWRRRGLTCLQCAEGDF